MLKRYRRAWNGPMHERLHRGGLQHAVSSRWGRIKPWTYRRGFIEALHVEAQTFLRHAPLLFQLGPIRHLKLWDALDCLRELICCPLLARVSTLDLSSNGLDERATVHLASSGYLRALHDFYLTHNPINTRGRQILRDAFPKARIYYASSAQDLFPKLPGRTVTG